MTKTQNIQRLSILLLTFFLGLQFSLAQGPKGKDHAQRAEKRLERMTTELDLSEAQIAEIRAIQQKYAPQVEALHTARLNGEGDHEKMKTLHQSIRQDIKAVLTPSQREKMKTMRGHHHGPHGHRGHGPRNPEVHAYIQEKVMPVIREQRAKLEAKISPADQALLAQLRQEMEALRPEKKAARQDMRQMRHRGQQPTEAQRAERHAVREQMHGIMDQAEQIATRYSADMEALHAEIAPQAETWKRELSAMARPMAEDKKRPESCEKVCERKGDKAGSGHRPGGKGPLGRFERKMDAAHFILMDPNGEFPQENSGEAALPTVDVFPNPARTSNSLRYEVETPGNVVVQLMTKDGRVVRNLVNEHHEAGTYSIDVETSDLNTDVYYYRVIDASGPRSKRFSIAK